jgi:hypothetical protein
MAGHGGVPATGTEEPFAVTASMHQFEFLIFDTIRATNGIGAIGSDAFYFANESMTFLVDGKTVVAGDGGFTGERFQTNGAGGELGINRHRSMELHQQTLSKRKRSICMSGDAQRKSIFLL